MNKIIALLILVSSTCVFGQQSFKEGEWLRYRMSYSKFFKAGEATLEIKKDANNNAGLHVIGKGRTTGLVSLFFRVRDNYETFIDKSTLLPYRFIRKINEGGYTKNTEIFFNQKQHIADVNDKKNNVRKNISTFGSVQDMLSTLYFLRDKNLSHLVKGDEISVSIFFDQETYPFKLRFLGRERVKTKFGKVNALKFMPMVQKGRVFKAQESVTVWVSDDENKIPLIIKASLSVGSLRADLNGYKGLKNPFNIIFD